VFPNYRYYESIEKLHKKYNADIIRTGPRELSIISADAIPIVHGAMSKCRKGPWYETITHLDGSSTHTTRSKLEHKERRKAWDRAFSATSLREYEPRVNRHSYTLINRLEEQAEKQFVRISDWVNFYSFDVMGDIGFSRSFGMLENGKEDKLITMVHKSMEPVSIFGHLIWLLNLMLRTVGAPEILEHIAWTSKVLKERKKIQPKENDIFSWLLDPKDEDIPLRLNADSRLVVVAGSDTTSATLTWLCYELCNNPIIIAKLQGIVDKIAPSKSFLDAEDLAQCSYLDGIIQEALRLHPAVSPHHLICISCTSRSPA
jgi:cytochrome P450